MQSVQPSRSSDVIKGLTLTATRTHCEESTLLTSEFSISKPKSQTLNKQIHQIQKNNSKIRVNLTKNSSIYQKEKHHLAIEIRLQCEEQDLKRRTRKNATKSGFKDSIA